jgi:hypothetical protein
MAVVTSYQATVVADGGFAGQHFATRVALSGDTMVVGTNPDSASGDAYVFVRSGAAWMQQGTLRGDDTLSKDDFGWAVAVSGDTAVVGALGAMESRGAAYVFTRSGATWTQQAKLVASDAAVGDTFGWGVAISGNTILVSAPRKSVVRGAVYAFTRAGTTWSQQVKLTPDEPQANSFFGIKLALNGDDAIIGAPFADNKAGRAYVFHRDGSTWMQQSTLIASDAAPGNFFGGGVDVDGPRAIVGAGGYDIGSLGAAYVFVRNDSTWMEEAKLTSAAAVRFGSDVAIRNDIAVIGAPDSNDNVGSAHVFAPIAGRWTEQAKIAPMDGAPVDHFGTVAMDGNTFAVGSPYHAMGQGAAYVYTNVGKAEPDAGVEPDGALVDASNVDTATPPPSSSPGPASPSGCGCSTPKPSNVSGLLSLLLFVAAVRRHRP